MKVRVGVDASIDDAFLEDFTQEVQLVRIPEEPEGHWKSISGSLRCPKGFAPAVDTFERRSGGTGSLGGDRHAVEDVSS